MRRTLVVAAMAIVLLAGCSPATQEAGPQTPSSSGSEAIRPEDLDADTRNRLGEVECSDQQDPALRVPQVDVSDFSFSIPDGFEETFIYTRAEPLEGPYEGFRTFVPSPQSSDTRDVIGILLYPQLERGPLVSECMQLDDEAARARIAEYNASVERTTALSEPELTNIGGLPAYWELLSWDEGDAMLRRYWIFGNNQMVEITCRWGERQDVMERGCQDFLDSVSFS